MAEFNRKELRAIFAAAEIEVPKDVIGQLCDLHTDSSDGKDDTIRDLRKQLKTAEHDRDDALAKVPKEGEETVPKSSYDKVKRDFDSYKQNVENEKSASAKRGAVREMLKGIGISEKHLDAVLRVYKMDDIELDEEGKLKGADKLKEAAEKDWSDFIVDEGKEGVHIDNPPKNGGTTPKTREEIAAIKDDDERRKAIAENMDLFTGHKKGNE